jgi:cell division protein FtsN
MSFNILKNAFSIVILTVLAGYVAGCNSPMYTIVEVEEPVKVEKYEPKPEYVESEQSKEYNKEVMELMNAPTKFADKDVVSRTYIIQIGAFEKEGNANSFMNRSQKKLPAEQIYIKDADGQYKVRFGSFNEKEDAVKHLYTIWESGFAGAFVLEVTAVKSAN